MKGVGRQAIRAAIAAAALCAAQGAFAQVEWCCSDEMHAGSNPEERCANNRQTFASAEECAQRKSEHDQRYGHDSTCTEPVAQERKSTVGGGSRVTKDRAD